MENAVEKDVQKNPTEGMFSSAMEDITRKKFSPVDVDSKMRYDGNNKADGIDGIKFQYKKDYQNISDNIGEWPSIVFYGSSDSMKGHYPESKRSLDKDNHATRVERMFLNSLTPKEYKSYMDKLMQNREDVERFNKLSHDAMLWEINNPSYNTRDLVKELKKLSDETGVKVVVE